MEKRAHKQYPAFRFRDWNEKPAAEMAISAGQARSRQLTDPALLLPAGQRPKKPNGNVPPNEQPISVFRLIPFKTPQTSP